jgi:2-oxoisovalerate dehydrogenase E2 component (dihydrolipoyl transacylase)
MGELSIKLPDVGEGVAEAELVEWHVKEGDLVREDDVLVAVMTDKATVEIPAPADGKVLRLGGAIGDALAVGSELIRLEVEGEGNAVADVSPLEASPPTKPEQEPQAPKSENAARSPQAPAPASPLPPPGRGSGPPRGEGQRPLASPAVRKRARDGGVDLRQVPGTGPAGRITHADLEAFFKQGPGTRSGTGLAADTSVREIKVVGLRRRIAAKMALSKRSIPHYSIVEEVDVSALEELRTAMNGTKREDRPRLTILPFLMRAMARAIVQHPEVNALYDEEAETIHQHGGLHIGIATQTDAGLMVPVIHHAEARDIWDCAAELARVSEAARNGQASREELTGSTITITSLGPLGAIATTPVINHPEVAIVGVNKIAVRPMWDGAAFQPRKMMNLSCSFDHRVVDGWNAAQFVHTLKGLLETPALIFVEG